ncbi:MAG TPA: serine/threonine-protein kinase [Steroidobacteraceae bacterium]|nr:serine/threonine-protein kinase [Steroidobacteraceae bacterium]
MSDARWEQIKELLYRGLQVDPSRRSEFLDEVCADDRALRAELASLLKAGADIGSQFLPSGGESRVTGVLAEGELFAERFRLLRKLGEGGMGQVWLAEQTAPVRRQVALKLIKAGMYDEEVVQRFQSERQSLAIMDHPAIAKVFDAGTTRHGQPYFVMEYVPGVPITEYCDEHRLGIEARIELFIQACEGVQHAHLKAIIHRDLKPANILVVEVDGRPVPRIIDFGLAKAVTPKAAAAGGDLTAFGLFLGTPGYMSPEQVDPGVKDIDTRTDVYSLGVVLYVLLAGVRPFDTHLGKPQPPDEWLRKLREDEPPTPSQKVATIRDRSQPIAAARGIAPKQLVALLRNDLDWITMKALERDRARRYATPHDLAADLRRYLAHEPVTARPGSVAYRVRKYVRRHRVGVGVAAGLALLFVAFTLLQGMELRRTAAERDRANQERDRANHERDRASRIADFMSGVFKVNDPGEARGNSVTAREILDKASSEIEKGLAKDPEVQSQMMQLMARTYVNLGLNARAHELAQRALERRVALHGADDPKALESMTLLGWTLDRQGKLHEAEAMERDALARERRVLRPDDPLIFDTLDKLAVILQSQGHYEAEETLEQEAIEAETRTLGAEDDRTMNSMSHLADALYNQARYPEAEREYRQVIDLERRVWGPDHPGTLVVESNLALAVEDQGRWSDAEQIFREALAGLRKVLGSEHQSTASVIDNLSVLLAQEGHLEEAEGLSREGLQIRERILGPEHPGTFGSRLNLSDILFKEGDFSQAEKLQRATLAAELRTLGPENPDTLDTQTSLTRTLIRKGRFTEAKQLATQTFEAQRRIVGPQHPETLATLQQLGTALVHLHRYPEAVRLFRDTIENGQHADDRGDHFTVWYAFACVAVAAGKNTDALKYLRESVNRGYKDADGLSSDDDLKPLRQDAAFQQLVAELRASRGRG